jgi:pimeloyl-ACP methyl ester carboxylesterase
MGGSSRPDVYKLYKKTPEESQDFFNMMLESWRENFGNLTGFVLAGHSFGGYISGNYAAKYPQHVKKLLLISPIGVRCPEENILALDKKDTWQDKLHKSGADNTED